MGSMKHFDAYHSELPTIGSSEHAIGKCKPCAFFHKGICESGFQCNFCHLCEPDEKKRRKKEIKVLRHEARQQKAEQLKSLRESRRQQKAQQLTTSSQTSQTVVSSSDGAYVAHVPFNGAKFALGFNDLDGVPL